MSLPVHFVAVFLKPQVVFFGETVPAARVEECFNALASADAMLVVGSSLMLYSGFRFVRAAQHAGIPIAAINRGKTRADELLSLKIKLDCANGAKFGVGENRCESRVYELKIIVTQCPDRF